MTDLPEPDFPDNAEAFAFLDLKAHAAHGSNRPPMLGEIDLQILDLDELHAVFIVPAGKVPRRERRRSSWRVLLLRDVGEEVIAQPVEREIALLVRRSKRRR